MPSNQALGHQCVATTFGFGVRKHESGDVFEPPDFGKNFAVHVHKGPRIAFSRGAIHPPDERLQRGARATGYSSTA